MSFQHEQLAAGRWKELTFVEQMAHIGSEVERFLKWRAKGREEYSRRALFRALELIDLTLDANRQRGRLREVARVREALVDHAEGGNSFEFSEDAWRRYFLAFVRAVRTRGPVEPDGNRTS